MYKKMLVPVDGSEFSACVLPHVEAIAVGCRVPEVILLIAVEPLLIAFTGEGSMSGDVSRDVEKRGLEYAKDYLAKVADKLKKGGIAAQTVVVKGRAADEILNYADKNGVDLIIMSTHGRSGVTRWVLGSVADRVVRRSTVPVLAVSPPGCKK